MGSNPTSSAVVLFSMNGYNGEMAKTSMVKYDKRVIFPVGGQKRFLCEAKDKLNLSWLNFAKRINTHPRTLNDWKREAGSMPLAIVKTLSCKLGISIPKDVEVKDPFWYARLGAKKGYLAVMKKHGRFGGNSEYRKKKWREWWERDGQYKVKIIGVRKPIKVPRLSKKVAEFTGIVMGDGGLTKLQLQITLHKEDDKLYAEFVRNLIMDIFKVPVSVCYLRNVMAMKLVVSRINLVEFCNKKLGLSVGNKLKHGLDIPNWIKENVEFQKACIRGLVDTDGCIFNEVHHIKGKVYSYKRLNFTSASPALRQSVFNFFDQLGLLPKIRNNKCVQIEKRDKIEEYFKIIGTNNPKHKRRFMEGCSER